MLLNNIPRKKKYIFLFFLGSLLSARYIQILCSAVCELLCTCCKKSTTTRHSVGKADAARDESQG
jgi:hypothetical protein